MTPRKPPKPPKPPRGGPPAVRSVDQRWEAGDPHDPRSEAMARELARIDLKHGNDYFDWRFGGDGDNGEELLYLLDVYFELQDRKVR